MAGESPLPREHWEEFEVPKEGLGDVVNFKEVRRYSGTDSAEDKGRGDLSESLDPDPTPFTVEVRTRDHVRAWLAFSLFALLAGTVLIILASVAGGLFDHDQANWAVTAFIVPEVALLGAATGWFYGK